MFCIESFYMFIVANCADFSLALMDWTKHNFCLFGDVVTVSSAHNGHDVEGEGCGEGLLASSCEF